MDTATPIARTRKPRGQGAARRGEILAAAKQLFLQEGIEHATMRRIAATVGVSSTALYVYFPDKTAILDAIAEAMFEALLIAYAQSQRTNKPQLARFRDGLQSYVDLALSRPDEYRLTFGAKTTDCRREIEAADKSFGLLQQTIAELMQAGILAPRDTLAVAEALWACLHGVVMLLLNQPEHIGTTPQRLVDTVLDATVKGFMA